MSLVWHIVRKDLRRMAVPLAACAVLHLVQGELGVSLLFDEARNWVHFDAMSILSTLLLGVDVFVTLILTAILVQDDGLVGTRSFWMTRPMSGARLLAAKFLGALLMFGVLPILLSLRWWLVCGYGAAEIGHAALVTLDRSMLVVLVGFAVAALTPNMSRFLLGLLLAAVATIAGAGLLARSVEIVAPDGLQTRASINAGFLALGAIAAIATQFLARQRRWALLCVGLGYTATLATGVWNWSGWHGPAPAEADALRLTAKEAEIRPGGGRAWVRFSFEGLPATSGLEGEGAIASPAPSAGKGHFLLPPISTHLGLWQAAGLAPEKFKGTVHGWPSLYVMNRVEPRWTAWLGDTGREWPEPGGEQNFAAELALTLVHPVRDVQLPLRAGADVIGNGCRVRVVAVEARDGKLHAQIVESRPTWINYPHQGLSALAGDLDFQFEAPHYYLVTPSRGELRDVGAANTTSTVFGTQGVRWLALSLEAAEIADDTRLTLIHFERSAPFRRRVVNENLPVTAAPADE